MSLTRILVRSLLLVTAGIVVYALSMILLEPVIERFTTNPVAFTAIPAVIPLGLMITLLYLVIRRQ